MSFAVFVPNTLVIGDGIIDQMSQIVFGLFDVGLDLFDFVVRLVAVETRNTDKFQFGKPLHVLQRNFASQHFFERLQTLIDRFVSLFARFAALD